jgi:hypothetical protein
VFTGFPELFDVVRERVVREYGPLHPLGESPEYPFPATRTYEKSMGTGLRRKFFVPGRLFPQEGLAPVKRWANALEAEIRSQTPSPGGSQTPSLPTCSVAPPPYPVARSPFPVARSPFPVARSPFPVARSPFPVARPINIDPGILNDCRIILASTTDFSHRIYRGEGIWEEVTLQFERGAYRSLPWTYPDFRALTYHPFLLALREDLLSRWKAAAFTTWPRQGG